MLPSFGQSQYGTILLISLNRAIAQTVELAQRKGAALDLYTINQNMHSNEANYFKIALIWLMIGSKNIMNNKKNKEVIRVKVSFQREWFFI